VAPLSKASMSRQQWIRSQAVDRQHSDRSSRGRNLWPADELQTSRLQAAGFTKPTRELGFKVLAGPTGEIRFAGPSPYETRLGYCQLPTLLERLAGQGFEVTAQARMSPRLLAFSERGLSPTFREKHCRRYQRLSPPKPACSNAALSR